nr:immunoglobulin light chain junction region [Macaca mulatta]
CLQYNYDPLTF